MRQLLKRKKQMKNQALKTTESSVAPRFSRTGQNEDPPPGSTVGINQLHHFPTLCQSLSLNTNSRRV